MERLYLGQRGYRPGASGPVGASDPQSYVALESFERVLRALSEAIDAARSPMLLDGVEGAGKTLLLRVLAARERWGCRRVAFSPFLHLPAEDVARWLLHLLGRDPSCEGAADAALIADVRQTDGARTILLVDEIQCSPEASVRRLAELAIAGRPQLVVIAAGASGARLDRARAMLEPELRISLPSALPASEMEQLCDALLARSPRKAALRASSPEARSALLREAGGVPGELTAALTRRARGAEETISSPLLDSVRGPEPPLAVLLETVPTPRSEAEKARERVAARDGAGERPAASPAAPVLSREFARGARAARVAVSRGRELLAPCADGLGAGAAALRRAWAGMAAGLRRATRRPAASQRWTRVEAATSRRVAPPAAPPPRAQASNAPWLPRAEAGEAAPLPLPPPLVPRATRPARAHGAAWLRSAAARGASSLRRVTAAGAALRARARRASGETASALSSRARAARAGLVSAGQGAKTAALAGLASAGQGARAALVGLASAGQGAADLGRALFAGERGKATAAAALLVVGTVSAVGLARQAHERDGVPRTAAAHGSDIAPAAGLGSLPAAERPSVGQGPPVARAAAPVRVQVNARPWAYIRVDGVDVGPTPLSLVQLTPGRYEFEASFPDGRSVRRSVEITPEQRFVSMP